MTVLLLFMALAMCFTTLLMLRIAHGNDMRTVSQRAADAAALGAAAAIRDRGALALANGVLPYGIIFDKTGSESAARHFAGLNEGVVDSVHPSGLFGYTVKVNLHSKECQTKLEKGTPYTRYECQTPQERQVGHYATAEAIAKVGFPSCAIRPRGSVTPGDRPGGPNLDTEVVCDGEVVTDNLQARRFFTIRLVDEEEREAFDPGLFNIVAGIPPGGVRNEANRQLGKQLAAQRGWTGSQWECLDQLWQHESGWDHTARNPSSGAYGIPQSLPPTKMATHGGDYLTNPATQIRWGLDYIAARPDYGTPCRAWALWQSRSPHWY
jgi:hypothetical protein